MIGKLLSKPPPIFTQENVEDVCFCCLFGCYSLFVKLLLLLLMLSAVNIFWAYVLQFMVIPR